MLEGIITGISDLSVKISIKQGEGSDEQIAEHAGLDSLLESHFNIMLPSPAGEYN